MNIQNVRLWATVITSVIAVGCGPTTATDGDETDEREDKGIMLANGIKLPHPFYMQPGYAKNGLTVVNGIDFRQGKGTTTPALGINVAGNPVLDGVYGPFISSSPGSDLARWFQQDIPMRFKILEYLVQCALPSTKTVRLRHRDTTTNTLILKYATGKMNLAPSWYGTAALMSVTEQERVTACMLARTNASGALVDVLLAGPFAPISTMTATEATTYDNEEIVAFGNLFLPPTSTMPTPPAFFCTVNTQKTETRLCGKYDCTLVKDLGPCTAVNHTTGVIHQDCPTYQNLEPVSGAGHFKACNASGRSWYNPITTRVKGKTAGSACVVHTDCASNNCVSGSCAAS